ncbi:MAG: hypothetical protein QOK25_1382 [Thermoleophilaceae bacterium]|jgi:hypothetical protein|nr:hypothetical protein [Thermoleophilaceae bacterium]
MTYEDQLTGRIEGERIDRLVEWLEATLGPRLTAFATGSSQADIGRIAHGDWLPGSELERRLRNLYAVVRLLTQRDRPGTPNEWLTAPNPELANRAPAELLREGESPEPVWFAAAPTF